MKISITAKHIERGEGGSPDGCALAIAINEQIPTCEVAVAGGKYGAILRPLLRNRSACTVALPERVQLFVKAFDIFKKCGYVAPQLKPFSFELDVPSRLLAAEPERATSVPRALEKV